MDHTTTQAASLTTVSGFLTKVYGWMTIGLAMTALIAAPLSHLVNNSFSFQLFLYQNEWVFPVLFIIEIIIVIGLSGFSHKLSGFVAAFLFLFYSAINGLFFGIVISGYTEASVFLAFGSTALTFLVMSLYGYFSGADLTRWGQLALMGLIGVIIGTILNFFFSSSTFDWILTYLGLGIFIILVAYDTQKIKRLADQIDHGQSTTSLAIVAALQLYLDFINIAIRMLQIMGRRR